MRIAKSFYITSAAVLLAAFTASAPVFELIPLWGIKVKSSGIEYSNILVKPELATNTIVGNEIPANTRFGIHIENPKGFDDSAGFASFTCDLILETAEGKKVSVVENALAGKPGVKRADLKSIVVPVHLDATVKANTQLILKGHLKDRNGKGFVKFEYAFKSLAATKKLPANVVLYQNKDSRGMKCNSAGLHYNFFEFKGKTGNNFLFRIGKGDEIRFSIRGLEGWKAVDGKVSPVGELLILDAEGNEIERDADVLAKTVGETMPKDKKEIEVKYQPQNKLSDAQFYLVWLKLRDKNTPKYALDMIVKVYVE